MTELPRLAALDPVARALQRISEALGVKWLEQIIQRVHLEGAQCKPVVGGHKHDDGNRSGFELLEHPESVQLGHLHVQKNQVGPLLSDGGHRLASVRALANDLQVGLLLKQLADSFPRQGFVVNNQHLDFHS